jgi:hypothetical protein
MRDVEAVSNANGRRIHAYKNRPQSKDVMLIRSILQEPSVLDVLNEWEWLIAPIVFTALAFFTRLYKIGLSPIVTWDEAQSVVLGSRSV